MPQVHGDPDEIRAFATYLDQYCTSSREQLLKVREELRKLGDSSWTDALYREYSERFDQVTAKLFQTLDEIQPEQVAFLTGLAQRLDDILNG